MGIKTINVTFTDEEHETLLKEKGKRSWRKFILSLADAPIEDE